MERDISDTATASRPRGAPYPRPPSRRFRVYALDPRAALTPDTATVNNAVISLPWETSYEEPLAVGPTGEYIEVVDFDAPANRFYAPLNPNHPDLLAQDGLPPSEGRPQFHQQMTYAVAMKTIFGFERALGRKVLWSSHYADMNEQFIQRLRIYPHALSRGERLLFAGEDCTAVRLLQEDMAAPGQGQRGGGVFTCLSHDIIAHETAHAILHGMHRRFDEEVGPDTFAFHEAFADIVALLQHFTMAEVVAHQITASIGPIAIGPAAHRPRWPVRRSDPNWALAPQRHRSRDRSQTRKLKDPIPLSTKACLSRMRGAPSWSARCSTPFSPSERRTADLMRLATGSSTPSGDSFTLTSSIGWRRRRQNRPIICFGCRRGLDYLPVTDVNFGEYLRAIVTADRRSCPKIRAATVSS